MMSKLLCFFLSMFFCHPLFAQESREERVSRQVGAACEKLVEVYQACPLFHRISEGGGVVAPCAEKMGVPASLESSVSLSGTSGEMRLVVQGPRSQMLYSQPLQDGFQKLVWSDANGRARPKGFSWLLTRLVWIEGESAKQVRDVVLRVGDSFELDQWAIEGERLFGVLEPLKSIRESSLCRVEEAVIRQALDAGASD